MVDISSCKKNKLVERGGDCFCSTFRRRTKQPSMLKLNKTDEPGNRAIERQKKRWANKQKARRGIGAVAAVQAQFGIRRIPSFMYWMLNNWRIILYFLLSLLFELVISFLHAIKFTNEQRRYDGNFVVDVYFTN